MGKPPALPEVNDYRVHLSKVGYCHPLSDSGSDMKKHFISLSLIALSIALVIPSHSYPASRGITAVTKQGAAIPFYADCHALVVGVGGYTAGWPNLPGALRDSREVAEALKKLGFTVKLLLDPTSSELKETLQEMAFVTGSQANRGLLFYFAGHGETLNLADGTKLGYIIPRDCPLKNTDPMKFDRLAISMKEMEALSLKAHSRHFLMVFDSCFSGSLFNLVRAAPVEISEKSAQPVRQFITAGSEGEQVPDQSVFKQVFLDGIHSDADLNKDGYVTGSELGMHLQTQVVNYSRGGQHPQYGKINNPKLDKGDFIFITISVTAERRARDEAEEKKAENERAAVSEELKTLQEERRKSAELLEQMKQILEAKVKADEAEKRSLSEQRALDEQGRRAEEDRALKKAKTDEQLKALEARRAEEERALNRTKADEQLKTVEAERRAVEEKLRKEAAERKALEEELKRLRDEQQKSAKALESEKGKGVAEKQLAYVPEESPKSAAERITLRSEPLTYYTLTIVEKMIVKYNFFVKYKNDKGDFPNQFVDNKDGSVTDQTTGLMWQKTRSPSLLYFREAQVYVNDLRKSQFLGHHDWRMPTLEELCSLLERVPNQKRRFLSNIFTDDVTECWTSDFKSEAYGAETSVTSGAAAYTVNFSDGTVSTSNTQSGGAAFREERCYLRVVRSVK